MGPSERALEDRRTLVRAQLLHGRYPSEQVNISL